MHADQLRGKRDAQKRFYTELKRRFGLSAQPAIRVIGKVADAYATLRANIDSGNYGPPGSPRRKAVSGKPIGFQADATQPFDARDRRSTTRSSPGRRRRAQRLSAHWHWA